MPGMRAERPRCPADGCERPQLASGFCKEHGGSSNQRGRCKFAGGCTKQGVHNGFCISHGGYRYTCNMDGCEKWRLRGGFCMAHGGKKPSCRQPGCTVLAHRGGLCYYHNRAFGRSVKKKAQCKREGCEKWQLTGGFCLAHGGRRPGAARRAGIGHPGAADGVVAQIDELSRVIEQRAAAAPRDKAGGADDDATEVGTSDDEADDEVEAEAEAEGEEGGASTSASSWIETIIFSGYGEPSTGNTVTVTGNSEPAEAAPGSGEAVAATGGSGEARWGQDDEREWEQQLCAVLAIPAPPADSGAATGIRHETAEVSLAEVRV